MDSQVASTSREKLDSNSSPMSVYVQQARSGPLPLLSKGSEDKNDVSAVKSHATVLMQTLQSLTLPSSRASTLAPLTARTSSISTSPKTKFSSMGPPTTPSMTRSAQRSRAAALSNARPNHVRTPSHATGLGDIPRKRIDVMSRLVEVLQKSARLRYEISAEDLVGW